MNEFDIHTQPTVASDEQDKALRPLTFDDFAGQTKIVENLRVFVPDTDYVLYRDGVGCEANPWAEHLDRVFRYSLQNN